MEECFILNSSGEFLLLSNSNKKGIGLRKVVLLGEFLLLSNSSKKGIGSRKVVYLTTSKEFR